MQAVNIQSLSDNIQNFKQILPKFIKENKTNYKNEILKNKIQIKNNAFSFLTVNSTINSDEKRSTKYEKDGLKD